MPLRTWWNHLRGEGAQGPCRRLDSLHSAQAFRALLHNERLRSDRNGTEFALVRFRLSNADVDDSSLNDFADAFVGRLRATDHAGWFGRTGGDVAVLLWSTGVAGAHRFVDAVRKRCVNALPLHDVYVYPSDPASFDDGAPVDKSRCTVIRKDNLHDPLPHAKPLHALFVQPLPRWKRALDVVGAGLGLIALSPLLLLTAAAIKLTSRGGVLFTQTRDGHGGRPFIIYKFRTMLVDADADKAVLRKHSEQDGPCFKMTHDPRITPLGRYLRKTCIDELPQLWNVLKGDMTLVGPRPLDSREARNITGFGRRRMDVTPGLTCIWQVHGKSRVSFTEWMRMDLRYIALRSIFQDAKLIVQTAAAVLLHRASI
ncbi:MAG: sugar transferase [Planctomycetaceae bacterium]